MRKHLLERKDGDTALRRQAERLLGSEAAATARREQVTVTPRHREALEIRGDAAAGALTFAKLCAPCHRQGKARPAVGPDLATLTDRTSGALLRAIVDPNAAFEEKYAAYTLQLRDGRLLTGVLGEETATSVHLEQAGGERQVVLRKHIVFLERSDVSMMPEGLVDALSARELADLIAYVAAMGAEG